MGHYSSFTCICTVRTIRSKAAFATLSSVVHSIVQFGRCPSNLMNVVRSYAPPARDRDALRRVVMRERPHPRFDFTSGRLDGN